MTVHKNIEQLVLHLDLDALQKKIMINSKIKKMILQSIMATNQLTKFLKYVLAGILNIKNY